MSLSNFVLLPSTEGVVSITGSPIRASGSFRNSGGYESVITATDMTEGRFYLEATMDSQPTAWFPINIDGEAYLEFPSAAASVGGVQTYTVPFDGNFTWVRARLDRSYTSVTAGDVEGYVSASLSIDGYQGTIPSSTPPVISNGVLSVIGESLGSGAAVFAANSGTANVALSFRSIVAGAGIDITQDSTSIQIASNATASFTGLTDTANSVVANSVVIGQVGNTVGFSVAATNATVFSYVNDAFVFTPIADMIGMAAVSVSLNGNAVVTSPSFNFTGDGATVTDVGGVATVNIGATTEYVVLQYSPGSSGNLNTGDALVSKTSGVSISVVDATNCIVAFTFTDRAFPPTAIALMGQSRQTNEFSYSNINPSISTRKIAGGGTSAAPTIMGAFAGPVTLQVRMTDTGASAPAGQRAQAIVMFRF